MTPTKPKASPIKVTLDAEKLEAQVEVSAGVTVSPEDVLRQLQLAGVVHGIDADRVRRAITRPGLPMIVAIGTRPVTGAAGRIEPECLEASERASFTPIEDERGVVDCHGGHVMPTVETGQVLAHIVAPQAGTPGRRVTGEVIPATTGAEASPVLGQGAGLSEDRTRIVAIRPGLPDVQGNRISVLGRCEVKNVDFQTGDVYFAGSVLVAGDVLPGFTVVATEDIEVKGSVEGAKLRAGGKITVAGGVTHAAELDAIGDVAVRYVDSKSEIKSGGTLAVRENALRSTLVARRIVVGHQLVAGTTTASEQISAKLLGNESETPTPLEIRPAPRLTEKRAAELAKAHDKEMAQVSALRKALLAAGHDATVLKRLVPQEVSHELELRRVDVQAASAREPIAIGSGTIVALAKLFRGVSVNLYGHIHTVIETAGKKTLRLEEGEVIES